MSKVWIKMIEMILNVYLFWGALQDVREKTISHYFIKVGILIGLANCLWEIYLQVFYGKERILSLVPGIVFLVIAKISAEKIGYGDGMVFLILGSCMKPFEIWCLWQVSLWLDTIYSLIMVTIKKLQFHSKVAFLPFVWVAYNLLMLFKFVSG